MKFKTVKLIASFIICSFLVNAKSIKTAVVDTKNDTIILGGGCFWCVEASYELLNGVLKVESGYAGGDKANPSYKEVCAGSSGHAEVVQIIYNLSIISLTNILEVFFTVHDPTTKNRQGNDVGTQYRSVIFYRNQHQQSQANSVIKSLTASKVFTNAIVTEVVEFKNFYKAENFHQDYFELNKEYPYCKYVVLPKVEKVKKVFKDLVK